VASVTSIDKAGLGKMRLVY